MFWTENQDSGVQREPKGAIKIVTDGQSTEEKNTYLNCLWNNVTFKYTADMTGTHTATHKWCVFWKMTDRKLKIYNAVTVPTYGMGVKLWW